MKLTTGNIRSLTVPAGKTEAIFFDDKLPGFGLRVRDGGSRTWVFQYKIGSKQRRLTLGSAKAISLEQARDGYERKDDKGRVIESRHGASHLHAMVKLGQDPAGNKAESKSKAAETFGAVVKLYLAHQRETIRPSSYVDVERHLLTHAKTLKGLQLDKIERRDIATCVAALTVKGHKTTSNRVRTSLSGFFAWAISQGIADRNPVVGTARNEEEPRNRVLSPLELQLIWNSLGTDHFAAIIKLLALTGQRAGEIAGMRWSEVDLDKRLLRLPGARTKNHRPHTVPLSAAAISIINAQPRRAGSDGKPRDLIFGMGEGPFSGWSNSKETLDADIKKATGTSLPHWTPHDLRRSFATHCANSPPDGLGIQPHVVEAILNHVSGHKAGVAGIYNHATYEPEKRTALDRWAEHLLGLVEGRESNVTTMRRPA